MNDNLKNIFKLFLLISLVISNVTANEKAKLKALDFTDQNVLHDAVRANDFEMVKYLVKQGVNINKQDEYEYTPLHLAVRLNLFDITSYLIDNNATVNTTDTYKDTPLIDATRNNDTKLSKLLICNGANRTAVDVYGMTALHNSAKNKNQEIVNLLRVDNLKPYCQQELEISMDPFEISEMNAYSNKICGDITKGFVTDLTVTFTDEDDEIFGPFPAVVDNKTKKWCIDTEKTSLKDDIYTVTATATDYVINTATALRPEYVYAPKLDIIFENKNSTTYPYPRICGSTNSDAIDVVDIILEDQSKNIFGLFPAEIDDNKKRWCADVTTELHNGYYTIQVQAHDLYDQYVEAQKENYFVDTMPFEISIEDVAETNNLPHKICVSANKTNVKSIDIKFVDENNIDFLLPSAKINNINNNWCSAVAKIPPKGMYKIKATGITTKNETAFDLYDSYNLGIKKSHQYPKISINNTDETMGNKPEICGKILEGEIVKGKMSVRDKKDNLKGTYKLRINTDDKTWCSTVSNKLYNGIYAIDVVAMDRKKIQTKASDDFEVYVIPGLYDALMSEFKNDMQKWNAHLDKNSLIFSFRDPNTLFEKGDKKLNKKFQKILENFFPRYVKVTANYKEYIQNIIIEGHSSSENRMGKNKIEKYKLNKKLSIARANNVLSYTNKLIDQNVGKNILWIVKTFESDGLSSSKLIYNNNGTENKKMSRRVEFRIKNTKSTLNNKDS